MGLQADCCEVQGPFKNCGLEKYFFENLGVICKYPVDPGFDFC
jgi:hypothetical protein